MGEWQDVLGNLATEEKICGRRWRAAGSEEVCKISGEEKGLSTETTAAKCFSKQPLTHTIQYRLNY